jgi:NTE family protein
MPLNNTGKLELEFRKFDNEDEYYQTLNFSSADTADVTGFIGESALFSMQHNTLNRKQWASEGSFVKLAFRYIQGKEQSLSGNTLQEDYDVRKFHRWINLSLEGRKYFKFSNLFRLGVYGKTVLTSQSLFSNYTASILATTEFSPLPDSRTLFLQEYRAPQYAGAGVNIILSINDLIDIRLDPYFFQPFKQIVNGDDGTFGYSENFEPGTLMAGGSIIFHSPVGPLRVSTNYFPRQEQRFLTQVSFGYVLFNDRAIR